MSPRTSFFSLGLSILALTVVSCGGAPRRTGPDPVPVGEWCQTVGRTLCNWKMDNCLVGAAESLSDPYACENRFAERCAHGRNRFVSSGHSYDELNACVDLVENTSCPELGITSTSADHWSSVDFSRLPENIVTTCSLRR